MNKKLQQAIANMEGYMQLGLYTVSGIFIFAVLVKSLLKYLF